jgi:hypothetical protein
LSKSEDWARSILIAIQRARRFTPAPIWDDLRSFDAHPFSGSPAHSMNWQFYSSYAQMIDKLLETVSSRAGKMNKG